MLKWKKSFGLLARMAYHIRDELSIIRTAADLLINDSTIPAETRDKIALVNSYLGNVAQHARQFLLIYGH